MPRIHVLSQSLINKIAAGEVIERPASVVKELMENSIDAGATRIDISVENGGQDLIRISDNGCGISSEDMLLAVTSHATSKLSSDDDLFSVATMGFRGEALASVAEVSRMCIQSRVNPDAKPKYSQASETQSTSISGTEIEVVGGNYSEPHPCGCPPGTQIEVRNLFFNTPVRKKFLKTQKTEFGHITETFERLALANPHIHFTLKHGRIIRSLPGTDNFLQRIRDVEGAELADSLIYVEEEYRDIHIYGYVAHPNYSKSDPKNQYLFLNGRPIRDRSLQHALNEAYRGLLTVNRYPISYIQINMPVSAVDVNVHPTKMEVRFQDSGVVYSHLLAAIRNKFLESKMVTFVNLAKNQRNTDIIENLSDVNPWRADADMDPLKSTAESASAPLPKTDSQNSSCSSAEPPWRQQMASWAEKPEKNGISDAPNHSPDWGQRSRENLTEKVTGKIPVFRPFQDREPLSLSRISSETVPKNTLPPEKTISENAEASQNSAENKKPDTHTGPLSKKEGFCVEIPPRAIQLHQRYIVTASENGIMLIDQHAMHERILFERLKIRLLSLSVETQRLLVPEPIDLRPTEAALLLERQADLEKLGVLIEPFGGNTILVQGLPAILFTHAKTGRVNADELIHEILQFMKQEGSHLTSEILFDHTLSTLACKAAVKAGQKLSREEIEMLLDMYAECSLADHCPHGRPSILEWSCTELDKMFHRT
ncbi:MAG: DNA mismatch repair endonuclease MutL [Planctomycetia bacterium]|nr:DNA mismatch repair endonuclease MutL [Planctomycetia bacterium]